MFNPFNDIKRRIALRQMAKFFSKQLPNPVTRTPREAGLAFEDVSFKTEDGLTLKAWYLPSEGSTKIVIFNHFMLGNRAGAVPNADWGNVTVDFMPIYKALVMAGYAVFTYDLRNHGASEVYKDGTLGLTHTEYKDAVAAMRYANEHYADADKYLYSQCYGTVSTMRAIEQSPDDFKDIKAYVSIQPLSADAFVEGVTKEFGIDDPRNVAAFSDHLEKRTGYTVDQLRVPDLSPAIKMPTLLVQVRKDFRTTNADIEQVYEGLASEDKELLWIDDQVERLEGYNHFARNPDDLVRWLNAR